MPRLRLPKFTFINGPPGSGKSTLATLICADDKTVWRDSFAEPIRQMLYSVFFPEEGPIAYSFDLRDAAVKARHFPFERKDVADVIKEYTFRDVMISFSEQWMKPTFGDDIFGRLALRRCIEQEMFYDRFVFDDSGFAQEALFITSMVGVADCCLIRLHRSGCDFSNDSRGYINLPGVKTIDLHNNSTSPPNMMGELALAWGHL